jgi:hypothetical protein
VSPKVHNLASLATDYNNEVVVPNIWLPPRFDRPDWMWIKSVAQVGPSSDLPIRDVQVGTGKSARRLNCMHRTQPRRNFTVFYRRLAQDMILVIGLGRHLKSNTEYAVKWADGRSNRINLKKTTTTAELYLINPLGGTFGFETMDPLINDHFGAFG